MHTPLAIVTGANRGLGKNTALKLAADGVDLIITYRNNAAEAAEVVAAIEALGRRAACLRLDVADSSAFAGFAADVKQLMSSHFEREQFDYLVNNAGSGSYAALAEVTEEQFDGMLNVHLKGVVFLTQKLLPLLADGGRIVNLSSGLARFAMAGYGVYAAMKGGVEVYSRYLAQELGPRGIAVNVVAPGAIATDFGGGVVRDNPAVNAHIAEVTAMGRVGEPDDIGGAIAALLLPANRWITGQRIEVSGGMCVFR